MKPITIEHEGIQFTIQKVVKNNLYKCTKDCYDEDGTNSYPCFKHKCSLKVSKGKATATEVTLLVLNATDNSLKIKPNLWEMIDTNGFSYNGFELCDDLYPPRAKNPDDLVSPKTRAKIILVFPELEDGVEVSAFLVGYTIPKGGMMWSSTTNACRIELKSLADEANDLFNSNTEAILGAKIKQIELLISSIKKQVFSRLNNILTNKEKINLDNNIMNIAYDINQHLAVLEHPDESALFNEYFNVMKEYEDGIQLNPTHKQSERINDVEKLLQLHPRAFEEWTALLYIKMGYEDVQLTQYSNDKGIDVLASKDGERIAIQCKRFKGSVGSPMIRDFYGAMMNIEANKGIFITTGSFSVEAEKMALGIPIELYDSNRLNELIKTAEFHDFDESLLSRSISIKEIAEFTSADKERIESGKRLFNKKNISNYNCSDDFSNISANVIGSKGDSYSCNMQCKMKVVSSFSCSCLHYSNFSAFCKHLVALYLLYRSKLDLFNNDTDKQNAKI